MTSELSDALNPNAAQSRLRSWPSYASHYETEPPATGARPYIPHRSELELAIVEPPPLPRSSQEHIHPEHANETIQNLLQVVAANQQAAELEKQRRRAWEREQEAKYAQREAELEKQVRDMQEEITSLKSQLASRATSPQFNSIPTPPSLYDSNSYATLGSSSIQTPIPLSSESGPSYPFLPQFIEGSSTQALNLGLPSADIDSVSIVSPPVASPSIPTASVVSSPLSPVETISRPSTNPPSNSRKRLAPADYSDDSEGARSDDELSDLRLLERPLKRKNGHDSRCLTIHHAMRLHFLRVMDVKSDKELPYSHMEGVPLSEDEPVRFVWENTVKKSSHNSAMKKRVVTDLKTKRRLYEDVPDKDFEMKSLEAAFDQVFTTFRQKYKAQKDSRVALNLKQREEQKALKARRVARKKTKLNNRLEARKKMPVYAHSTFDAALQQDCMSSEESCNESPDPSYPSTILQIRPIPWRSSRLMRFYATLDEHDLVDRSLKPRRHVGRKERCIGPEKDGIYLPPKGIGSWMVSRRWMKSVQMNYPEVFELLKDNIKEKEGFDWNLFRDLGEESEDEDEQEPPEPIPRSETSYSLAHALSHADLT
ncbi:hypothetical protein C8Q75DRAFT_802457 [Abortiporus biennis]|nr:hypothetical protein C8Q75DRAFT_802457 [Abortiporus biennis]